MHLSKKQEKLLNEIGSDLEIGEQQILDFFNWIDKGKKPARLTGMELAIWPHLIMNDDTLVELMYRFKCRNLPAFIDLGTQHLIERKIVTKPIFIKTKIPWDLIF